MKKLMMIVTACLLVASSYAQSNTNPFMEYQNKASTSFPAPTAYLGFSTGINNMIGILGPQLDVVLSEKFTVGAGIGLSTWGSKWALNLKFYPKGSYQFYLKGGYSQNSGIEDVELEMELTSGKKEKVLMDLNPVGNIFFAGGYAWKLGQRNKFFIEAGHSICLQNTDYYRLHNQNIKLSSTSKNVLHVMRPGGLIIALGMSFAL